ncbi:MAG: efflux RND transporter periplasmic adaptor subunit [Gemmatimonadales bacterium]
MRTHGVFLALLAFAAACGGNPDETGMPGMSAEDHARMQAGGTQGPMDSTGAAVRQSVHLTPAEERALGVVYTTVSRDVLIKTIRTVGEIAPAESMVVEVTPRVAGFVERLFVSTTGESVRRGQPLLSLYSPELVAAQEELLTARRLVAALDSTAGEAWANATATLDGARRRLRYWEISQEQITRLERTGEVTRTLTLVSPVNGIVLDKGVVQGQQIMPGMRLYRVADLSRVWIEGEVFEQDLQDIRRGAVAHIEVEAYPGEHLMGQVSFVYPTVDVRSRTNRVRISVANPGLRLKPGMFATIYFDARVGSRVLSVPMAAVIATGERNLVFVRDSAGTLRPREVVLGARAGDRVQILSGLDQGETIVESANFLVDAESRLAATGGGMPGMQHSEEPMPPEGPGHDH